MTRTEKRSSFCISARIRELYDAVRIKGLTIVPVRVYLKGGRAKVEIAIAKGKKQYDKRETIKQRDIERERDVY